jgi:pyruvate,orthophosphate dikinase
MRLAATLADSHENVGGEDIDGVLLVLENPTPDEIPLILSVDGLLAARGGSTSHAAVAVHGIEDKQYSAVLGVAELRVTSGEAIFKASNGEPAISVCAGEVLSIHGQTGEVFIGSRQILGIEPEAVVAIDPEEASTLA